MLKSLRSAVVLAIFLLFPKQDIRPWNPNSKNPKPYCKSWKSKWLHIADVFVHPRVTRTTCYPGALFIWRWANVGFGANMVISLNWLTPSPQGTISFPVFPSKLLCLEDNLGSPPFGIHCARLHISSFAHQEVTGRQGLLGSCCHDQRSLIPIRAGINFLSGSNGDPKMATDWSIVVGKKQWPISWLAGIYTIFRLDSRMNSEVHNDTAPDSGGGVSAFETMVTQSHIGDCNISRKNTSRLEVRSWRCKLLGMFTGIFRNQLETVRKCIHRNRLDQQYSTFI